MASQGLRSGRLGHPSSQCQGEVGPGDGRVVVLEGAVAPNVSSPAAKAWSRCPAGFPPVPEVSTLGIQRGLSRVSWNLSGGPPPEACRGVGVGRRQDNLSLIHISEPTRQAEISYAVFCLK